MADYPRMYLHLFNAITDALKMIDKNCAAAEKLRLAQQECEEMFISDAAASQEK